MIVFFRQTTRQWQQIWTNIPDESRNVPHRHLSVFSSPLIFNANTFWDEPQVPWLLKGNSEVLRRTTVSGLQFVSLIKSTILCTKSFSIAHGSCFLMQSFFNRQKQLLLDFKTTLKFVWRHPIVRRFTGTWGFELSSDPFHRSMNLDVDATTRKAAFWMQRLTKLRTLTNNLAPVFSTLDALDAKISSFWSGSLLMLLKTP